MKSINSSTVLVDKLKSLGLVIGGYKDIIDIATTMGVKSNDKIERFTELDHMITKVYESYIDPTVYTSLPLSIDFISFSKFCMSNFVLLANILSCVSLRFRDEGFMARTV